MQLLTVEMTFGLPLKENFETCFKKIIERAEDQ